MKPVNVISIYAIIHD